MGVKRDALKLAQQLTRALPLGINSDRTGLASDAIPRALQVKWGPADTVVHQKTITVDAGTGSAVAAIGTGNLQQQYYASTLDAWILDRDQAQVSAVGATFASDWAAAPGRLGTADQAAGLVWSPGDQAQMVAVIDDARKSVQLSSEELSDTAVIDALAARARAGVTCQVLMTEQEEYDQALRQLQQAGCSVRTYADKSGVLYVHELSEAPSLDVT